MEDKKVSDSIERLMRRLSCDVVVDEETRTVHSKDTSLFTIYPQAVVYPKHASDIKEIVRSVSDLKKEDESLSITARSGGSDMTGGPLNTSVIISCTKYMNHFSLDRDAREITIEPGVFYRDTEKLMEDAHLVYPAFPASRGLCAWGGMVMNNAAGEKTLKYGQTRKHVREVSMVLADGNEYIFGPLSKNELNAKMSLQTFEGELYRKIFDITDRHYDSIKKAEPQVSKNSSGYALWSIWDKEKGIFDLSQLFVGSQGTLGIMTRARLGLVSVEPHESMIAIFLPSWNLLPELVNKLLPYKPESLETFDDATLKLGIRFMPEIARKVGQSFLSFAWRFLPEALMSIRMLGLPKLIILVELAEKTEEELRAKEHDIENMLKSKRVLFRTLTRSEERDRYWVMRRESFNLLRGHVKGKRTAPFVEDFCVTPDVIPEFLPKLLAILKEAGIEANIAGHAGNGNFHIIPLMDLNDEKERAKIIPVADKVYDLVIAYNGTITAEHNDGIIRTPYVKDQFGPEIYALFEEVKNICDPQGIFNPGKKVGGTKEDIEKYLT